MRITENMINRTALSDIQSVMRRYSELSSQMTSGKTVRYPSDNAAIASRISNTDSRLREIERYKSNINYAESMIKMYDTNMQEVNSIYLRIKELAVKGANGSLTQDDREKIETELDTLNDHLVSIANTKVNGDYIFGGAKTDLAPVKGNSIQTPPEAKTNNKISVGGYDVEYGVNVYDAFVTKSGTSIFKIVDRLKNALHSGKLESINNELGSIEEIQKQSNTILAKVGGNERLVSLAKNRMESFELFTTEFLSKDADVDITKVFTDLNMQMTVMNSALKTTAKIVPPTLVDFL